MSARSWYILFLAAAIAGLSAYVHATWLIPDAPWAAWPFVFLLWFALGIKHANRITP